jgi:formate hydrogenlyase subunit 3/multisubunit Na+/H+ antiporter MnhD subunit
MNIINPGFILLLLSSLLAVITLKYNNNSVLRALFLFPFLNFISLLTGIFNGQTGVPIDESSMLMAYAICALTIIANCLALLKARSKILALGTVYSSCALICVTANDIITLFIALELMMLFSCALILISSRARALQAARIYFLAHLCGGILVLIGASYLFTTNQIAINSVSSILQEEDLYSKIMLYTMLIGLLLNAAASPFSGWMTYAYSKLSDTGFLYLYPIGTKVTLFALIKIFHNIEWLSYVGLISVIYASLKAFIIKRNRKLFLEYSVMSLGIVLLIASMSHKESVYAASIYLICDAIYKLCIFIMTMRGNAGHTKPARMHYWGAIILFGLLLMQIKNVILFSANHYLLCNIIFSLSFFTVLLTAPWQEIINPQDHSIQQRAPEAPYSHIRAANILTSLTLMLLLITLWLSLKQYAAQMQITAPDSNFADNLPTLFMAVGAIATSYILRYPRHDFSLSVFCSQRIIYLYKKLKLYFTIPDYRAQGVEFWELYRFTSSKIKNLYDQQTTISLLISALVILSYFYI